MNDPTVKRLSRLVSILTLLQSKKIRTAATLAETLQVSTRTIYRDMTALEKAGVPIVVEDGKGYSIVDGYKLPPVMFTEEEANALLTMELVAKACKDESLRKEYTSAMAKLKAVLPTRLKSSMALLEEKIAITKFYTEHDRKSTCLLQVQKALLNHIVITIHYTDATNQRTIRDIEPFAIYSNATEQWVVIAFCRLRHEFRSFLLAQIADIDFTNMHFIPQAITFERFYQKYLKPT